MVVEGKKDGGDVKTLLECWGNDCEKLSDASESLFLLSKVWITRTTRPNLLSFLMPLEQIQSMKGFTTARLRTSKHGIWIMIELMSSSMFGSCEHLPEST